MTFTSPVDSSLDRPSELITSLSTRLAAWARTVTYENIPSNTIAAARSQLISNLAAIRASLNHPIGQAIVAAFGPPVQACPKQSAYVMSALATALDFDEVVYSGHVSAGAVNVAISEAEPSGLDGKALLATIIAANECAARISAATTLSSFFRGQTNTHCHLTSAAVARLHARRASLEEWTAGLGLAFGILPVPLHHGVVTSEVKAFAAAASVRMALDACDAAAHGLAGSGTILEDREGLLAHLSAVPMPEAVIKGLGHRWHTDTLTYKRFPGSAYIHAAFDCAERLHRRLDAVEISRIRRIVVHGSLLTWLMERKVIPFLNGPQTSVSAITLSVGYGVATLLLTGTFGPEDLAAPAVSDEARWSLAAKVAVEHDRQLSERMIRATSPLGEALRQAGNRALKWAESLTWDGVDVQRQLADLGTSEDTFENATMAIGARVDLELTDGTTVTEACDAAIGSAGAATRRDHRSIVRQKFLATGGSADVLSDLERLDLLDPARTSRALSRAVNVQSGQ